MLQVCPQYETLHHILSDRNTDVANPGNSEGSTMTLVPPSSNDAASGVLTLINCETPSRYAHADSVHSSPSSKAVTQQASLTRTMSIKKSGKKRLIDEVLFGEAQKKASLMK
ncbi:hypothetical protein [Parasitella parasitica]|uniref:Uncharacterized protein n=1 Tax=Parasitella parasitica TaxID=35722 RepID=A0A0B7N9Y8_9FUNG|nr:hypothetical protein [Parasitella parasitica]